MMFAPISSSVGIRWVGGYFHYKVVMAQENQEIGGTGWEGGNFCVVIGTAGESLGREEDVRLPCSTNPVTET